MPLSSWHAKSPCGEYTHPVAFCQLSNWAWGIVPYLLASLSKLLRTDASSVKCKADLGLKALAAASSGSVPSGTKAVSVHFKQYLAPESPLMPKEYFWLAPSWQRIWKSQWNLAGLLSGPCSKRPKVFGKAPGHPLKMDSNTIFTICPMCPLTWLTKLLLSAQSGIHMLVLLKCLYWNSFQEAYTVHIFLLAFALNGFPGKHSSEYKIKLNLLLDDVGPYLWKASLSTE